MSLENDLYKSLIDESRLFREKVATLWLQKFTMLGAIIAFAATRAEATSKNPDLIAAAILSLPLIAILLDIKLAEFGVHGRIIDDFIIRNYREPSILADWERVKWGDLDDPDTADRALVRFRSIATVTLAVVPTCIIAFLAVLAAKPFLGDLAYRLVHAAVICFCPIYLVIGLASGPAVLFRRIASMAKRTGHMHRSAP